MKFDVDKHIEFVDITILNRKTKVFNVWNNFTKEKIGIIRWYNLWRYYCFFPYSETIFSDRCLIKIGEFVKKLNEDKAN